MKKIKYGNKSQSDEIWRQLGKAAKIIHFQIRLNLGPTLALPFKCQMFSQSVPAIRKDDAISVG